MSDNRRHRFLWAFEGLSWISLVSSIAVPLTCYLVLPRERIVDRELSITFAKNVYSLIYLEGLIAALGLFAFLGLKKWKPVGLIVRSAIGIIFAGFGAYTFLAWAFALSFMR